MAYRRRRIYWIRVPLGNGRHVERSTETGNRAIASAIEGVVRQCVQERRWDLLDGIAARRLTVGALYDARQGLDRLSAELDDVDLLEWVTKWHQELVSRKLRSAGKYVSQVRIIIGTQPKRSMFGRAILSASLAGLSVSPSSRNRYRAALSAFASWLVERGILQHNPVRDIRGFKNAPPRETWLPREDAQRLIAALPEPLQSLEALLAGTGMEMQAALRVRRRDIDLTARTVYANGGKTPWRQRTVRVTEDWCWPYLVAHAASCTPQALLWPRAHDRYLDWHRKALKHPSFAGWPRYTLHDHRHTWAVNSLKDGMPAQLVAHQLGHRDTTLLMKVYGRYIPAAIDFDRYLAARAARAKEAR